MEINLDPGKYVVAVSGGVDSVSLLHMLRDLPDVDLVVAHFDHGIRTESGEDRRFVEALTELHGLPFIYEEGQLGVSASEAKARQARYEFLEKVRSDQGAAAIVTAHHTDDVLETAIINMLRGTGRKGLSALGTKPNVVRPLVQISKSQLLDYAGRHNLEWREDRTNQDTTYLRNHVRHQLLSRFTEQDKQQLQEIIDVAGERNREIDTLLAKYLPTTSDTQCLERQGFVMLPHDLAREVMAGWLRANGLRDFDSKTLERLVVASKTGQPGSRVDILRGRSLSIGKDTLTLLGPDGGQKKRAKV